MREVVVLLAVTSVACATSGRVAPDARPPCAEQAVIQVGSGQGVVFPAGRGFVDGYKYGTITEYWTPTEADIGRAEEGLSKYLINNVPSLAVKFSSYARQYTGFVYHGRKRLFMNFFCSPPSNWRCEPVGVDDGGDCYFRLEYDVVSGEYSHLSVNGSA